MTESIKGNNSFLLCNTILTLEMNEERFKVAISESKIHYFLVGVFWVVVVGGGGG